MAVQIPFPLPATGYALNSKVRVNLDFLVDKFNEFNSGTATWDSVAIGTANSLTGNLTFYNASNAFYLTFRPGATAANTTFTLPTGVPSVNNAFLQSSTAGVMSWSGISWNLDGSDNGLVYVPAGGTSVDTLANGLGTTGILIGASSGTPKYVQLLGTSNQVTVTINANDVTLSLPQNVDTAATFQVDSVRTGAGALATCAVRLNAANTGFYMSASTTMVVAIAGTAYASLDATGWFVTGQVRGQTVRSTSNFQVSTGASGIVTIQALSSGGTYTLTLPTDDGAADEVLKTDGSGNLSWVSGGSLSGTVATGSVRRLALYPATGTTVDDTFTDSGFTVDVILAAHTLSANRTYTIPQAGASASFVMTQGDSTIAGRTTFTNSVVDIGTAGTASRIDIYPSNATSGVLSFAATNNSAGISVNVTNATHAVTRTYTIIDAGANANFVMTQGAQTLVGTMTFSAQIEASDNIRLAAGKIVRLQGSTSVSVDIKAAATTTSYTLTLPANDGDADQVLKTDGSGATSWTSAGSLSGTVASGTAGRLALYPSTGTTVDDIYVQNANNIDVIVATHATLAASRTYTLPDSGASASFIMSEGAQTKNGALTLGSNLLVNGLSGTLAIDSNFATSNAIDWRIQNTQTGAAGAHARLRLSTQSGSGGDPYIWFEVGATPTSWALGGDNSDSDAFVLTASSGLGAPNVLRFPTTGEAQFIDGTASLPAMTFISDVDTGMYRPGANQIGMTLGGTLAWTYSSGAMVANTGNLLFGVAGTVSAPFYSFDADRNTGIYNPAADELAVTCGASQSLVFKSASVHAQNGSQAAPSYSFINSTSTGLYYAASSNTIGITSTDDTQILVRDGNIRWDITGSEYADMDTTGNGLYPVPNSTSGSTGRTLGYTSFKWRELWAWNSTIQTSSGRHKAKVRELKFNGKTGSLSATELTSMGFDESIRTVHYKDAKGKDLERVEQSGITKGVKVPRGIVYRWKGDEGTAFDQDIYGFLGDDLPVEAHAIRNDGTRDPDSYYTSAVIGILCSAVTDLQERLEAVEKKK